MSRRRMGGGWFVTQAPTEQPLRRGGAVTVNEWERALLLRHGRLVRVLDPGTHRRLGAGFAVRLVDLRPWVVTVPTQELPTREGATVKVTVAGQVRVVDPVAYVTESRDPTESLYLAVQVAMREVVATATIDELLADRVAINDRLLAAVHVAGLGLTVDPLVVKDVVLPGDLKRARAAVLVARAEGLAALERARGETAALRGLANAARMAADNPAMLQLRLLQQLESSSGNTVVIGVPPAGAIAPSG